MILLRSLAFLALASAALSASADVITQSYSVLLSTTFINPFTLSQFDPSLGTLTGITFVLRSDVYAASMGVENTSGNRGGMISVRAFSTAILRTDAGATLATAVATASLSKAATAYDGTTDFGGASGLLGDLSTSTTATTAPTLTNELRSLFVGSGSLTLMAAFNNIGTGWSSESGSFAPTQGQLRWGGNYEVTYIYDPAAVPGPLAALPFALMVLRRKRG